MAEIQCLGEFQDTYPEWSWLETLNGFSRYSNGEGEGSDHESESEWFCDRCEFLADRRDVDDGLCEFCDEEEAEDVTVSGSEFNGDDDWL
jgi:hypothetical protein